jgi:hypothetical protein
MSLPVFRVGPNRPAAPGNELARLNSERQFKPFVYLNSRLSGLDYLLRSDDAGHKRKAPPRGGTFLLSLRSGDETLAIPLRGLALTVRILLLLAGLGAAALLLLLTGLLARVLILLARLVLVGHLEISVVERSAG